MSFVILKKWKLFLYFTLLISGRFSNAPIGNVYSEDDDDWDIGDKDFFFEGEPPKYFRFVMFCVCVESFVILQQF